MSLFNNKINVWKIKVPWEGRGWGLDNDVLRCLSLPSSAFGDFGIIAKSTLTTHLWSHYNHGRSRDKPCLSSSLKLIKYRRFTRLFSNKLHESWGCNTVYTVLPSLYFQDSDAQDLRCLLSHRIYEYNRVKNFG